jgi:uncharacterized protein (DUF1015 family)
MAQIIPFRGYRFDPKKVGEVTRVVTPPYDRVDSEMQEACYARSPYNIVRIIRGRPEASDDDAHDVYTRAAEYFQGWMAQGILVRDEDPGLYVYHQEYAFEGHRLIRKGIIALGKLEPEKVHAHEKTLKGPKEDRLKLMRATEANFGHIFMLYSDPARTADRLVGRAVEGKAPLIEAKDTDGNLHRVWRVKDRAVISAVQKALAPKDLYIADGHHRYETAVNYMRECQAKGWVPAAPESFDVRMMTLFNISEPGMSIRPIHRLVHGVVGFDVEAFLGRAEENFLVERHSSFAAREEATRAGRGDHTFGVFAGAVYATLTFLDEALMTKLLPGNWSKDFRRLDVSILQAAILGPLLGIDAEALEEERNVTYTVSIDKGRHAVETGAEQALFLLNATTAEEVVRVADHGEKMPQKSTDFYPKLLTGLVVTRMEIKK